MSAKNHSRFSPMLGQEEKNQCWFLLQADLCAIMFFQNTLQSGEMDKSAKTNEQFKVTNSYNFTTSSCFLNKTLYFWGEGGKEKSQCWKFPAVDEPREKQ